MTGPIGDSVGEVRADLRIDSRKTPDDVEDGLRKAGRAADDDAKDIGENWGRVSADAMGAELERNGPRIARSIQDGLDRERVVTRVTVQYDREGNVARRWVTEVARDLKQEVTSGSGRGPFNSVGQAISDAIGAGFNISGRSPLIVALIPILAVIVELILAAVQASQLLVAALYTIPNLLFAVGLQAGVLLLIFKDVGEAVGAAFSAKNPEELRKALDKFNPDLRKFVTNLLPLRDLFRELSDIAQSGFFRLLGDPLKLIADTLGKDAKFAVAQISTSLGTLFSTILTFFADPNFQGFFREMIPSITKFLAALGPAFVVLLDGLTSFGRAMIPFVDKFGAGFNDFLESIGRWLQRLSTDEEFQEWLFGLGDTLKDFLEFGEAAIRFLKTFTKTLDEAGGGELIQHLTDMLNVIAFFTQTEVGKEVMEGLIHLVLALASAFLGLLAVFFLFLFLLESVLEFFAFIGPKIKTFFTETLPDAITAFGEFLVTGLMDLVGVVPEFFTLVSTAFIDGFLALGPLLLNGITTAWNAAVTWVTVTLPQEIKSAVSGFGTLLLDAGKALLDGLIQGLKSRFPNLAEVARDAAAIIRDVWPFSPAKEGPLSGSGDLMFAGQNIIDRLAAGMLMETPKLEAASNTAASTVMFGANAINVGFHGALPTQEQAQMTGMAAGRGIMDALARRNTRLQVRTM